MSHVYEYFYHSITITKHFLLHSGTQVEYADLHSHLVHSKFNNHNQSPEIHCCRS